MSDLAERAQKTFPVAFIVHWIEWQADKMMEDVANGFVGNVVFQRQQAKNLYTAAIHVANVWSGHETDRVRLQNKRAAVEKQLTD